MATFWRHRLDTIGALGVAACSLLTCLLPSAAGAEQARLVADLESGSIVRGSGRGSFVSLGAEAGHRFVFAADDDRHGRELWVSDGTEAGTSLILDVCPGRCASDPRAITRVGNKAYFFANDGAWPHALYVTDGTAQGTRRVHELAGANGPPSTAAAMGDLLVFDLHEGAGGRIFRSDGTRAGTRKVERCPGCSEYLLSPAATSRGLFWRDSSGSLLHLNAAGDTLQQLTACSPCGSAPVAIGDGVVIIAPGSAGKSQLLKLVDPQGPPVVLREFPGPVETYFDPFVRSHGKLYFTAQRNSVAKLYETDGTPQGTVELDVPNPLGFRFSIVAGPSTLDDVPIVLLHSHEAWLLYGFQPGVGFKLIGGTVSPPQWVGHSSTTIFITNNPGQLYWMDEDDIGLTGVESDDFVEADRTVVDLGNGKAALRLDFGQGLEPWSYQQGGGLAPIAEVAVDGEPSSNPEPHAVDSGYLAVTQPQRPDLPPPVTNLFRVDDDATQATPSASGRLFTALERAASGLFLRGSAEPHALYFSDGTAEPANLEADRVADEPGRTAASGGRIYFTTDLLGQDVWTSDGTVAGTREIHDPHPDFFVECNILCPPDVVQPVPYRLMASGNQVFWTGRDDDFVMELWRVDHQGNEPRLLASGQAPQFPMLVWRGTFYFLQWDDPDTDQQGVWQLAASDGLTTRIVKTLTAPAPYSTYAFGEVRTLAAGFGDAIYFVIDGRRDPVLWRSDGTAAGTVVLAAPGADAAAQELVAAGSRLFLALATPEHGSELWVSDGNSGFARIDVRPGPFGSHPAELRALLDGRLLFAADDGVFGHEPWISDGTPAGTRLLADIGPGASSPGNWTTKGNRVLFAADAGVLGRELYALDPAPPLPPCPADRLCLQDGRFEVEVAFAAPDGASGLGRRALTSDSSGVFTFFSSANWELTVKVLDGCALNDRFWVFAAATTNVQYDLIVTDRATGATKTWRNPAGTLAAAVTDTGAFATCAAAPPAPRYGGGTEIPQAARLCPGDASALCLGQDQRFRVSVAWETEDGVEGTAEPVPYGSADSGLFTFFSADNWELMVKVLDGCAINDQHWLFAAGTTNVGWTLTLEDRHGLLPDRTYENPVGTASAAIADVAAMACTP